MTFERPVDLDRIGVTSGASGDAFLVHDRPQDIQIAFDNGNTTSLVLEDKFDFQTKTNKGRNVRKIQLTITSVYPSAAKGAVAISELEFFQKRKYGTQYAYLDPDLRPTVAASSTAPSRGTANLQDLQLGTAWASGDGGDGRDQSLTFTFPQPVDIDRIRIAGGNSDASSQYLLQPRPKEMHLTFSNGVTKTAKVPDSPGFHNIGVKAHQVTTLEIVITDVYGSANPASPGVAIAEIEFQTKRT
jgi:hypothetical protein